MHSFYKILIRISIIFIWLPLSQANTLPENHAINGGLTIIPIDIKQKPEVYYDNHRVAVIKSPNPDQWLMIVGVPLSNIQSIQQLHMTKPMQANIPFHVSDKYYKTQYLTIDNQRKVDPYAEDKQRIEDENKKLTAIFSQYSQSNPFAHGFIPPAYGPISSQFGLKRVYNKQPRAPHSGLDIAAPENAPVTAISPGKVVEAGDYFFTGNTVIIDHGMGIFSLYAHLKKIDVKQGEQIKQGQLIGTVGMTGRVTGPHLHWSMIMNQTYVNPLLFVPERTIATVPKQSKAKEG
ncbi:peptidoglycan DD-metalloendopeptidase family protein [Legionella oakridgensis]|uniref:Membrane proteins related to metalloendopeptidase n=2 Tax=Legionella oakridgensis TaxID=29423 RepID=W0B887_9GAMM|nr:peptidoglycan DD-metalloendopeptidase family protein [Legionella oakridgensis]AHE66743.1 membrane proteins related to metalloendopeptidase [Legionella oakridgensis ATCC 33761 = DSM 21215]ETO93607.1 membrane protein [Legionella oakridgensis RV-2-2007]KTD38112.1 peptidase, M23/M37 family [Legionella oakridgensis]STY19873.1 peptidase, M23/M37 family [Legionella longbeachae]